MSYIFLKYLRYKIKKDFGRMDEELKKYIKMMLKKQVHKIC